MERWSKILFLVHQKNFSDIVRFQKQLYFQGQFLISVSDKGKCCRKGFFVRLRNEQLQHQPNIYKPLFQSIMCFCFAIYMSFFPFFVLVRERCLQWQVIPKTPIFPSTHLTNLTQWWRKLGDLYQVIKFNLIHHMFESIILNLGMVMI